jgi:hypothetical protein
MKFIRNNLFVFQTVVVSLSFLAAGCANKKQTIETITSSQTTAVFSGYITEDSVDKFLKNHTSRQLTKIILDSLGGEPIAAMRLGDWIFSKSLDVQVEKTCMSSCANYLFTAGAKKIVLTPGIVGWHGSALQKNFVDRDRIFSDIEMRLAKSEKISENESDLLGNAASYADYKYSQRSRPLQAVFYKKLQAVEYLTRAGQEPRNLRAIWTFGPTELKAFGVCGAELPSNYADEEYLKIVKEKFGISVVSLKLNTPITEMLAMEKSKLSYQFNQCENKP